MSDESLTVKRQLAGLNRLHQLQKQLRLATSVAEVGFTLVNDTQQLISYRQGFLWHKGKGVTHVSSMASVDSGTPYVRWCESLAEFALDLYEQQAAHPLYLDSQQVPQDIAQAWQEYLPAQLVVVPVAVQAGRVTGLLVLARENPWLEAEQGLLAELAEIYRFAYRAHTSGTQKRFALPKKAMWLAAAVVFGVLLLPIRISVLAPAEVVAKDALPIRAPYEGVVEQLHVAPNQPVKAGDLLVSFDDTDLSNRLAIAQQALQIARTEYRQMAQQAVFDEKGKLEVAIRRGMAEKAASEVAYLNGLLARTKVYAERAGIAVINDVQSWAGRPVVLGEQLFTLADPEQVELSLDLAIADAIALNEQAEVTLFLNIAPNQPIEANLSWLAYKAATSDAGVLSYPGRATFAPEQALPRVGLRGVARLYGERAPLVYYVLRRPLSALRQWLGF